MENKETKLPKALALFINNKGSVNWVAYQEILISLNSLTQNYSVGKGVSCLMTVKDFLANKQGNERVVYYSCTLSFI